MHAEEGQAAGQVGIAVFRVPASVRANESGGEEGYSDIFVLKTVHSHSWNTPRVQSAQKQTLVCQIQLGEAKFDQD